MAEGSGAPVGAMSVQLKLVRAAQQAQPPSAEQRIADLRKLRAGIVAHKERLASAIDEDFCGRSRHETMLAEISMTLHDIDILIGHVRSFMRPRAVSVDWKFLPARAQIWQRPLGVIGILSPWNYPTSLALMPLAAAIAAGNHVMVKPSEHTPRTAEALKALLAEVFPEERVSVILGGPEVAQAFAALPFDHLFFTGSTAIGRAVMKAAAENLTPVTLELGGKSPALLAPECNFKQAAARIAAMKFLNAGQTCIAPDYVLVPSDRMAELLSLLKTEVQQAYPDPAANQDYTSIINERQYQRLQMALEEAKARGAEVLRHGQDESARRRFAPTFVLNPPLQVQLMQEEIFGPILPIIPYDHFEEALKLIAERPRPLALYLFDQDRTRIDATLARSIAGGVCVNDVALHFAQPELPFGGVGPSGMGHYHGLYGMQAFSKAMPVFRQAAFSTFWWLKAPYRKFADFMLNWLTR
jgi:coniferyl-aldehyde dehydrogenase